MGSLTVFEGVPTLTFHSHIPVLVEFGPVSFREPKRDPKNENAAWAWVPIT